MTPTNETPAKSASERNGSEPLSRYDGSSNKTVELFNSVILTAASDDFKSFVAAKALAGEDYSPVKSPEDLLALNPGPRIRNLRKHNQGFLQLFTSRIVDDFQIYIVEILREVFICKPNLLCSNELSLSTEFVLGFSSIEDLRDDLIETKVNDLSYKGLGKLKDWCNGRGIPIVMGTEEEQKLIELISTRNLITHNRGAIDKRYLSVVKNCSYNLGETRMLDADYFFASKHLLDAVVFATDQAICKKFGIIPKPSSTPPDVPA